MSKSLPANEPRKKLPTHQTFLPLLLLFCSFLLAACSGVTPTPSQSSSATVGNTTLRSQPASIDFGTVVTNAQPVTRVFNLTNTGGTTISTQLVSITPSAAFSILGSSWPLALAAGKTLQLTVAFAPQTAGSYSATLVIRDQISSQLATPSANSSQAPQIVQVAWPDTPTPPVRVSPESITIALTGNAVNSLQPTIGISLSPDSSTVQSGQSLQFAANVTGTTNTKVTWTAALGSISPSGLYTSPVVATQTFDTVSAVSVADSGTYATASVSVQAGSGGGGGGGNQGPYSLTNQQPVTPVAYSSNPNSLTGKRLPSDVLNHLWGNTSSVTASNGFGKCILTDCGASTNAGPGSTWLAFNAATYGNYNTTGVYWAKSTDPWYVINGCYYCASGWTAEFQAPSNMLWPGANYSGDGDTQITIFAPDMNTVTAVYGAPGMTCGGSPNFCAPVYIGACPGGGHAGTQADPCHFPDYYSSVSQAPNYYTSQDWQSTNSQGYRNLVTSLGFAPFTGAVRVNEILAGVISHALYANVDCINAPGGVKQDTVFPGWPGTPGTLACASTKQNTYRPYEGMLFFADYSASQLACLDPAQATCYYSDRTAIPKVKAFQMMFLNQIAHYGGYVGETSGGGAAQVSPPNGDDVGTDWAWQFPSNPEESPYWAWAKGIQSTYGSTYMSIAGRTGSNPSADFATMGTFVNIPLMPGITGATDQNGHSCTSSHGCDLSGHIQVADPCVAVGLTGLASYDGVNACP